jgi:zinc D-Ala-D-Ala carboxypeptidase
MEAIRSVLARMDAIRTTIEGPRAQPAAPEDSSFADILSEAIQQSPGANSQLAAMGAYRQSMGLNSPPPTTAPPGLEGFGNGEVPITALSQVVGTDEHLWAPAARAFENMRVDAARQGVNLPISDGYRELHDQERLADQLGLYRDGGLAAVPGTSQHGWGRAVDLELDDRALEWMRSNAELHGFHETVPGEPWHWEFGA